MRPRVASGEKPKAFFPLTEIMPFKFKYNLNIDILVQNSNLVFSKFDSPNIYIVQYIYKFIYFRFLLQKNIRLHNKSKWASGSSYNLLKKKKGNI